MQANEYDINTYGSLDFLQNLKTFSLSIGSSQVSKYLNSNTRLRYYNDKVDY